MNPAVLSLAALTLALALSMSSRINVGWLALAFAWLIGVYQAGRPEAVMAGFPITLFLTLAGVTLVFSIAETNGTLDQLARRAIQLARGSRRVIPALLFVVACALSSVGPGAISTVALLAPLAMAVGQRVGVSSFLIARNFAAHVIVGAVASALGWGQTGVRRGSDRGQTRVRPRNRCNPISY